jgi:hypothetical protein
MNRVEKMAAHVVGPGDPKRLTEEREHGGYLEIHGGLLSILPHLPKDLTNCLRTRDQINRYLLPPHIKGLVKKCIYQPSP